MNRQIWSALAAAAAYVLLEACGSADATGGPSAPDGGADAGAGADGGSDLDAGLVAWAKAFGGPASDAIAMTADDAGNVYVTGLFSGTVDFGGGPLVDAGLGDIYVASYDAQGAHRWSKRFGATGIDRGTALAVGGGTLYVTGSFQNTVDFGGGGLASGGQTDVFALALDPATGAYKRAARFGGAGVDEGTAVVAAGSGFVLAGTFRLSLSFGGGTLTSAGVDDIFLAGFDGTGTHLWSMRLGGADPDYVDDVDVDASGNVYLAGGYGGPADFGGGALPSGTYGGFYVASVGPAGAYRWAKGYAPSDLSHGAAAALDAPRGRLLFGGWSQAPVDLGTGSVTGGFVASIDPASGSTQWAKSVAKEVHDVAVAATGRIYATGQDSAYPMLARLDADGNGSTALLAALSDASGESVAVANDALFVAGRTGSGGKLGATDIVNHGEDDVFLLRTGP